MTAIFPDARRLRSVELDSGGPGWSTVHVPLTEGHGVWLHAEGLTWNGDRIHPSDLAAMSDRDLAVFRSLVGLVAATLTVESTRRAKAAASDG